MKKSFLCLLLSLSFLHQPFAQTTVTVTWMGGDSVIGVSGIYGTKGIPSSQNKPGGRADAVSWTDASGNFWLFGGYGLAGDGGILNDLWKYNPSTGGVDLGKRRQYTQSTRCLWPQRHCRKYQ